MERKNREVGKGRETEMMEHGKVDGNQTEIVKALRKAGCLVESIADVGNGVPDLIVGFMDGLTPCLVIMEVKMPNGKLTDKEKAFAVRWAGLKDKLYFVVHSPEQALKVIGKG
jgi:hypothetical protein